MLSSATAFVIQSPVMDRDAELKLIRRAYAKRILAAAGVENRRLENAFAAVQREDFLAPGPWQIVRWGRGYEATPSGNPVYIYDDVVVAILPERNLNNGQPSLHAVLLASSARNLSALDNVTVVNNDGTRTDFAAADVIYVNAGATHPPAHWLDRLREGGRLILPLTEAGFPDGDSRRGAVFRIERRGDDYPARWISGVAIFPCVGGRDAQGAAALTVALARGGGEKVTRLYRHADLPDERVWVRGEGWCLAYR